MGKMTVPSGRMVWMRPWVSRWHVSWSRCLIRLWTPHKGMALVWSVGPAVDHRVDGETVDDRFRGMGPRPESSVQIWGRGSVSGHEGEPVAAVALNVTAIGHDRPGHVTVYPCDEPTTSTVNFGPGQVVANGIFVATNIHGRVCIATVGDPDVVIDVVGVDPTLARSGDVTWLDTISPVRLFDSRPGESTVDGDQVGSGITTAAGVTRIDIVGRGQVPASARAVVVNVTAVSAQGPGHTTVFGCDDDQPLASTSNVALGGTVANTAIANVSDDGQICVFTHMRSHLVVDVLAVLATPTD